MFSEKIERQEFAVRILNAHLRDNRLAHTYLFTGIDCLGGEDLAYAFACALNCEKGNHFAECDCVQCRKIENNAHPDVRRLGMDPQVRSIKIEEIRGLIDTANFKPFEGRWKVYILGGAGRLTTDASNALLKTLEEPPAHTIFILLVESKMHLLETIQSRSFEVRLQPLAGDIPVLPEGLENWAMKFLDFKGKNWDDLLQSYQGKSREELKTVLGALSDHCAELLRKKIRSEDRSQVNVSAWVDAIDLIVETKEAVEANANQKLALTRLGMRLMNTLPLNHCV